MTTIAEYRPRPPRGTPAVLPAGTLPRALRSLDDAFAQALPNRHGAQVITRLCGVRITVNVDIHSRRRHR